MMFIRIIIDRVLNQPIFWLCLFIMIHPNFSSAQINHSYPRIGIYKFGNAPSDWLSKFDLIITPNNDIKFVKSIKKKNPDTVILSCSDWNVGLEDRKSGYLIKPFPEEWFVRDSNGEKLKIYGNNYYLVNITNLCPKYDNKRYNQFLPEFLVNNVDLSAYDGIASQGLWTEPWGGINDIDFDRNGKNDYSEHGRNWVRSTWQDGAETLISNLRSRIPENKLILINSGSFHKFGWNETNGLIIEHSWAIKYNWTFFVKRYFEWMSSARKPHVLLVDGTSEYDKIHRPRIAKNYFTLMRFLLATTLLGDGYFSFDDDENGSGPSFFHYYHKYYDEFDLDLGMPTSEPQKILCEKIGDDDRCVWIRFFDKGVSILNAKGKPEKISDSDLSGLSGYNGPYFRFKGGQAPRHNNGEQFTNISLFGAQDDPQRSKKILGDAIILLTESKTVVSDIIIDNVDAGTSPGTESASFEGNWVQTSKEGDYYYCLRSGNSENLWGYAYALSGNGDAKAIYTPNIGVQGNYQVYEWHAKHYNSSASNVNYVITYNNGKKKSIIVDQSKNYGMWNNLGTYFLRQGTEANITISNDANGTIIADAFKFVFKSDAENSDSIPPDPPWGVKVKK